MAQTYPSRPIKLVIPFPPGGVNDAIGRPWADRIKTLLGTVVIEEYRWRWRLRWCRRSGAGAQPDGYTLVLANTGNMVVAPVAQPAG